MFKELLNNSGFVAIVGTIFGGAGLEIIRRFMDRKQKKTDDASKIRAELRQQIEDLRAQEAKWSTEEQRLEAEIERWKGLYYDLKEDNLRTIGELQNLTAKLRGLGLDNEPAE
jgi:chromosome segregation ATPase